MQIVGFLMRRLKFAFALCLSAETQSGLPLLPWSCYASIIQCDIIQYLLFLFYYIYIFIAIALDESIFLEVLHFPMKNIKSRDLEATPMGEATSKPASDVVCLLLFA